MAANHVQPDRASAAAAPLTAVEEHLERGEVIYYSSCPFPLPEGEDRTFLLEQELGSRAHKNISYSPHTEKAGGFRHHSPAQAERLSDMLASFSRTVTAWVANTL